MVDRASSPVGDDNDNDDKAAAAAPAAITAPAPRRRSSRGFLGGLSRGFPPFGLPTVRAKADPRGVWGAHMCRTPWPSQVRLLRKRRTKLHPGKRLTCLSLAFRRLSSQV